ncbi:polysaccharide deacetylase [Clostridium sp. CT7]|uniref:polysaccharide deacetylase family protein n=1 Tax=Clostridium sp. CT7 TaxID=2052574 RepID=UPI000826DACE|nr:MULTISPECIES: polysaccharide deacetylase family protein [Clostridium]PJI09649.1 polysaccharide deacetylase [Clostridium sp. CT7]
MNKNKRKKLLVKRGAAVCLVAVVAIVSACIIQRKYNKKNQVSAYNSTKVIKKSKIKKVKSKDNKLSGADVFNIENCAPGVVEPWVTKKDSPHKVAYLTFDDGPSINTRKILDILNQNNIKATFFLIGKNVERYPDLAKLEVANGETVANHTYSHVLNYRESPDVFVNDINRCDTVLKSVLGDKYIPKFVRFPGGAFGRRIPPFKAAVTNAGYRFINWNALDGDAEHPLSSVDYLMDRVRTTVQGKKVVVILMHDAAAKTTTVQALPQIIQYLKSQGYSFGQLQ